MLQIVACMLLKQAPWVLNKAALLKQDLLWQHLDVLFLSYLHFCNLL